MRFLGPPADGPRGWRERPVTIDAAAEDAGAHVGVAACVLATVPAPRSGLPLTAVAVRVGETIPTGEPLLLRSRRIAGGHHELEIALHDRTIAQGELELAGHDPTPRVPDLVELASLPFGDGEPDHRCDVFGAPLGLNRGATWKAGGRVAIPWIVEDLLDDGSGIAHPLGVAFLECVGRIAAEPPPGAATRSLHLRFFADLPVLEPIRVVALRDSPAAPETWQARTAAIDEEGVVYATGAVEVRRVRPEVRG